MCIVNASIFINSLIAKSEKLINSISCLLDLNI